ncbi:MAG: GNAT family N-acetyltransferase [Anaerobacillus sp.]|uniref:GNAT family N-acetyltransferase n=1 Tax=Anaerobacillus sp. TaxID=1872506 RepID=UPI00391C36CC
MKEEQFNLQIDKAEYEDKGVLRNLINLYEYDVSEFNGSEPNCFGVFEYLYLDHYWTSKSIEEEGRIPYLLKVNGNLAGFVLINNVSCLNRKDITYTIAEFFILRKWRRKGIGKLVAFKVFSRHAGKWEVAQERENTKAQIFWRSVIYEYTKGNFEELETAKKFVQIFDSN